MFRNFLKKYFPGVDLGYIMQSETTFQNRNSLEENLVERFESNSFNR